MRCVMTRVLPLPGPAMISRGPSIAVTASRWLSFSPSSIWSAGLLGGLACLRETIFLLIAILSAHAYETAASCSDAANSRSTASIIQSSMFV